MNMRVQIIAAIGMILIAIMVLELVRKRKLREEYSLLWLLVVVCLGVMSLHRPLVDSFADLIGVAYSPSALFIAAFTGGFFLLLHMTITISRLIERNKRLAQEIGLLKARLKDVEEVCEINYSCACERDTK